MTIWTTDNPVALEKLKILTLILPIINLSHKTVLKISDIDDTDMLQIKIYTISW